MLGPYRKGLGKPSGNGVVIVVRQVEHLDQCLEANAPVFILFAPDGLRRGEEVDNLDRTDFRDGCLFQPTALLDEPCIRVFDPPVEFLDQMPVFGAGRSRFVNRDNVRKDLGELFLLDFVEVEGLFRTNGMVVGLQLDIDHFVIRSDHVVDPIREVHVLLLGRELRNDRQLIPRGKVAAVGEQILQIEGKENVGPAFQLIGGELSPVGQQIKQSVQFFMIGAIYSIRYFIAVSFIRCCTQRGESTLT